MGYFKYSKLDNSSIILDKYVEEFSVAEVIEVPSVIDGFSVAKINSGCFKNLLFDGKEIIFPDKNLSILDFAIEGCMNLKKIILGEGNKFGTFIGVTCEIVNVICASDKQYKKMSLLYKNSLTIYPSIPPRFVFSKLPDGYFITSFYPSSSDTDVVIPDYFKGEKVIGIYPSVFAKTNISSITFNNFITHIPEDCFRNCYKLEHLLNISNIEFIGSNAFALTKVLNLNFLFMPKLTFIGESAFCYSGVNYFNPVNSDIDVSPRAFSFSKLKYSDMSLTDIETIPEGLFMSCTDLEEVSLPVGTNTIEKTAFKFCNKLRKIYNIDYLKEVGELSFFGCRKLEAKFDFSKINIFGRAAFSGVKCPEEIELPTKNLSMGCMQGVIGVKKVKLIGKGPIPKGCFLSASIQEIELDENIKVLGDEAFLGCSLKKINLDNITKVGNRCFAYSLIRKASFNNLKKIEGGGLFWGCINLKKISLNSSPLKTIPPDNYTGCISLSSDFS